MASLSELHWERIPLPLREIMHTIGGCPFSRRFYLGGGTAVALQLGHRVSVDLDFFSATDELWDESRREITSSMRKEFPDLKLVANTLGTLVFEIRNYYIGFFSYGYRLLAPPIEVEGVKIASLLDLGLMKLDAIATRGARKDFYDLYFIVQRIPLEKLIEYGDDKYPHVKDFGMMALTGLVDFSVADKQAPIETFPPVPWEDVKDFFVKEARRIGKRWFESQET